MINLKKCNVPVEEHIKRRDYHINSGKDLKNSINGFNVRLLDNAYLAAKIPNDIPMASDPRWCNRQFGAVNTVEKSACIAFVSKVILNFYGVDVSMEELLEEIEKKGYRQWKLKKRQKKTLSMAHIDFESLKSEFPNDEEIQQCKSLKEIFEVAGEPIGIGGSMYCIDNLIKELAHRDVETRIQNVDKIISNLSVGIPVPMRVQNSIYHNDPNRAEGHYVTLFGIIHGTAVVVDSSKESGIHCLPIERLFKAMIHDESLICAWNLSDI